MLSPGNRKNPESSFSVDPPRTPFSGRSRLVCHFSASDTAASVNFKEVIASSGTVSISHSAGIPSIMGPYPESHWPRVAQMCTACSHPCEERQSGWVCTKCNQHYECGQGDTNMTSQEMSSTCRIGVTLQTRSEMQEPGHQSPPSSLSKTAGEDESSKVWYLPHAAEVSLSRDQTKDSPMLTLSGVRAFQGSCGSAARGSCVAENSPSQGEAGSDEGYEPMVLDNNDEELNDRAVRSWVDKGNRQCMEVRHIIIGQVIDMVESVGLNPGARLIVLEDTMELEISDNTDMEE
ncbi:hypothetical protein FBEOM_10808 [Fusarium beomiforme]|uniref:Uncharacterized protein n=1 Tax=Fusarium beomiforme TaxID=44412 RepID=A0A9P5AAU9_9HYPO|nr:hypothetical protein FBEOM_10808 [Fusarium beomiforme]